MQAIVIGEGIGGVAAALTLHGAGLDVRVYEQAPELREVGAGIEIGPNAARNLMPLGLGQSLERFGIRPAALIIRRWNDGRLIARSPRAGVCEGEFGGSYYLFYRSELLALLAAAIPPAVLHLDHRCVGLKERGDRIEALFHNGETAEANLLVGEPIRCKQGLSRNLLESITSSGLESG
jgi:salicylate hydroxylase